MSAIPNSSELRRSVSRTLAANGYVVTRGYTHPKYVEIDYEKADVFGCRMPYRLAVTDQPNLPPELTVEIARRAAAAGRQLVVVSQQGAQGQLPLTDFLERLGGEVPRRRALTDDYHAALELAAKNELPSNHPGPAWRAFEELVADGLEVGFGRRARRLGGRQSGSRVPDVLVVS